MTTTKLPSSALLDTTFLVSLTSDKHQSYHNARDYLLNLQANKTVFYLSSLVAAEFGIKGDLRNAIALTSPRLISFDQKDAASYSLAAKRHPGVFNFKAPEKERVVIDLMLIAQAEARKIAAIISEDTAMCSIYLKGTPVVGLDIKTSYTDYVLNQAPLYNISGTN